jgi:integrase
MADMPRPRPPYLHHFKTRHGGFVWYVRRPGCKRVRIRAEFGTPEFDAKYAEAMQGKDSAPAAGHARSGSLSWLWDRYRETPAWRELAASTRRARENIMRPVLEAHGKDQCGRVKKSDIEAGRDRRAATPSQSRCFLDMMRGMFRWAHEAMPDHVPTDPTAGVKNPKEATSDGFPIWTEDEVAQYEARWPIGTRERVWIDTLQYSGLRRGDVVRAGKQHIRNVKDPETGAVVRAIVLATEKSQGKVRVTLPILPVLQVTLDAGPTGALAFVCSATGQPFKKESFGNAFRVACNKAKIKGKSAHGLRKLGATRAVNRGATLWQMKALFGWTSDKTPAVYTKDADRQRLAIGAIGFLTSGTQSEHPMCPPDEKVGTPEHKIA